MKAILKMFLTIWHFSDLQLTENVYQYQVLVPTYTSYIIFKAIQNIVIFSLAFKISNIMSDAI